MASRYNGTPEVLKIPRQNPRSIKIVLNLFSSTLLKISELNLDYPHLSGVWWLVYLVLLVCFEFFRKEHYHFFFVTGLSARNFLVVGAGFCCKKFVAAIFFFIERNGSGCRATLLLLHWFWILLTAHHDPNSSTASAAHCFQSVSRQELLWPQGTPWRWSNYQSKLEHPWQHPYSSHIFLLAQ